MVHFAATNLPMYLITEAFTSSNRKYYRHNKAFATITTPLIIMKLHSTQKVVPELHEISYMNLISPLCSI